MFKLRFGLRLLLILPLCVAASYLGWTTHASSLRLEYERDVELAGLRRALMSAIASISFIAMGSLPSQSFLKRSSPVKLKAVSEFSYRMVVAIFFTMRIKIVSI